MISSSSASQEALVEGHGDMAAAHRQGAEDDGGALADPAVGDIAADHRGEIDEAGVEAEDLRGERLGRERSDHDFDRAAKWGEAGDMLGVTGKQQLVDHVEHQQCGHAVIGKALPRFGEGEIGKRLRVAEKGRVERWFDIAAAILVLRHHDFVLRRPAQG